MTPFSSPDRQRLRFLSSALTKRRAAWGDENEMTLIMTLTAKGIYFSVWFYINQINSNQINSFIYVSSYYLAVSNDRELTYLGKSRNMHRKMRHYF